MTKQLSVAKVGGAMKAPIANKGSCKTM